MDYININSVTFRQLEICITVMTLGSFTEAANALYISQPTISKQVASLEQSLGITLFTRSKNSTVTPTPAGRMLISRWQNTIASFYRDVVDASEIQGRGERSLAISTTPSARADIFLHPVIAEFMRREPSERVRVTFGSPQYGVDRLLAGDVDLVICNPYQRELYENEDLDTTWLYRFPWSVGMLDTNPLAQRDFVTWADLRDMKFIMPNSQSFIRRVDGYCSREGFHPDIVFISHHFSGLAANVHSNDEVFITDRCLDDYGRRGFCYFDITDRNESGLILVARNKEPSERVRRLAEYFRERIPRIDLSILP